MAEDPRIFLHFKTFEKFQEKLNDGTINPNKHFVVIKDEGIIWVKGKVYCYQNRLKDLESYYNDWEINEGYNKDGSSDKNKIQIILKGKEWKVTETDSSGNAIKGHWVNKEKSLELIPATQTNAGLMNSEDKKAVDNLKKLGNFSHINDSDAFSYEEDKVKLNFKCKSTSGNSSDNPTDHSVPINAVTNKTAGVMTTSNYEQLYVTIPNDISDEIERAINQENTIEAAIGLNEDGTKAPNDGNYIKTATTIENEILALDTQLKTVSDRKQFKTINGDSGQVVANSAQDTLTVSGGTHINTVASSDGKTITINHDTITTTHGNNQIVTALTTNNGHVTEVTTKSLSGDITTTDALVATIGDSKVTAGKIASNAVETAKIKDSAVTTAKINNSAVTTAKIADSNVTTAKVADGAITTDKLAEGAVTVDCITDGSISTDKLANDAVITAKILDKSVTTAKINDSAVTTDKINNSAVTTAKINNSAVTADKIGSNAVTTAKINASAVTTTKIADANVTTAKIADSAITTVKINDSAVTSDKLGSNAVTTAKINASAVTTAKIADANVTSAKIQNDVNLNGNPTTTTQSATDNSTKIATTAFTQAAIDAKLAANDAMIYKGTVSKNADLPKSGYSAGWTYKVATAGTYLTNKVCEVGDMIIATTDATDGQTAINNDHWSIVQTNINGAVTGPASSVANNVATFNGTTGKIIKDSGFTIEKSVPSDAKFTDTTYEASDGIKLDVDTYKHTNSITAKTNVGGASNVTPGYGSTFNVPHFSFDAQGHITAASTHTVKIPAAPDLSGYVKFTDTATFNSNQPNTGTNGVITPSEKAALAMGSTILPLEENGSHFNYSNNKLTFNYVSANSAYLDEVGTLIDNTMEIPEFTGATSSKDGKNGLVKLPTKADTGKYLKGDGTWTKPTLTELGAIGSIKCASGTNINTVGTPSVTPSTSGTETTLTFNYLKGAKGDKGDKGDKGNNGDNGTSALWFTGQEVTGTSTNLSIKVTGQKTGDMYLNTSTSNVYIATSDNTWKYVSNIKGATGQQGNPGTQGTRGSRWDTGTAISGGSSVTNKIFSSSGITDALVGDLYLNVNESIVYLCTTGGVASVAKWSYKCSIKGSSGTNATTTAVTSKTAAGLCPQLPNETTTTKYLRQDGTWAIPSQLQTARSLWGQSFNGTGNVSGNMTLNGGVFNCTWIAMTSSESGTEPEIRGVKHIQMSGRTYYTSTSDNTGYVIRDNVLQSQGKKGLYIEGTGGQFVIGQHVSLSQVANTLMVITQSTETYNSTSKDVSYNSYGTVKFLYRPDLSGYVLDVNSNQVIINAEAHIGSNLIVKKADSYIHAHTIYTGIKDSDNTINTDSSGFCITAHKDVNTLGIYTHTDKKIGSKIVGIGNDGNVAIANTLTAENASINNLNAKVGLLTAANVSNVSNAVNTNIFLNNKSFYIIETQENCVDYPDKCIRWNIYPGSVTSDTTWKVGQIYNIYLKTSCISYNDSYIVFKSGSDYGIPLPKHYPSSFIKFEVIVGIGGKLQINTSVFNNTNGIYDTERIIPSSSFNLGPSDLNYNIANHILDYSTISVPARSIGINYADIMAKSLGDLKNHIFTFIFKTASFPIPINFNDENGNIISVASLQPSDKAPIGGLYVFRLELIPAASGISVLQY